MVYVVKQTDVPFSQSWQDWTDAVSAYMRSFKQKSIGIEIRQSMFASHTNDGKSNNIVFVRYKIVNKTFTQQKLDSVYFSFWADPDLGNPADDLVGCDTLLQTVYAYNDGPDSQYGNNPPAVFIQLVQGAKVYIPGVTFIDINNNGIYDEGTDTPLDTAYVKLGPNLGVKKYPGAKNQVINSSTHYQASDPSLGNPTTAMQLKNYQLGFTKDGIAVNPCTWTLGAVNGGVDCNMVNKKYWYSGDPIANIGWINVRPNDQRMMLTSGPFSIPYNSDVEIIAAYLVGRGTSALNSVTVGKAIASYSKQLWGSNFVNMPLAGTWQP